jgi:hypothetical protein
MIDRLCIQKLLDERGFDEAFLVSNYGIKARVDRTHPNLVLFKYDQIASPMGERIVQECRGVILDKSDGWSVVSRAFDKFFNHGEGHAAPIDWSTAAVQEKLDGSLCVLYAYDGKWRVATTGTPDGFGDVNGFGITFADYFWKTFNACGGRLPTIDSTGRHPSQFFFELCGKFNRVVVRHETDRVVALGARHEGKEVGPHFAADATGIAPVQCFSLQSFDDIAATFGALSPLAQEGYVVVDADFRRVKVKHPGYVALHHAKDGLGPKAFLQIARSGETSEVLSAFPEFREHMEQVKAKLDALIAETDATYAAHRHHEVQKDFAIAIKDSPGRAAMFSIRSGRHRDARHYYAETQIDPLMRLLGLKAEQQAEGDAT